MDRHQKTVSLIRQWRINETDHRITNNEFHPLEAIASPYES
jgi:hypothetical protein